MMDFFNRLSTRLFAAFVGLTLFVVVGISLTLIRVRTEEIRAEALRSAQLIAQSLSRDVRNYFLTAERTLRTEAQDEYLSAKEPDPERLRLKLERFFQENPEIRELHVHGLDGSFLLGVSALRPSSDIAYHTLGRDAVSVVSRGKSHWSITPRETAVAPLDATIAVPIEAFPGKVVRILMGHLDHRPLWDLVEGTRVGRTGSAFLVDARGKVLSHMRRIYAVRHKDLSLLPSVARLRRGKSGTFVYENEEGVRVAAAAERVKGLDLGVVVQIPTEEAFAPVGEMVRRILSVGGAAILLSVILGGVLARVLSVPIARVEEASRNLAEGRWEGKAQVGTKIRELAHLGRAFNEMAADLRAREDELRKEKANLKALLTASAKITSVLELDEALKAILDEATRTLSDRCSIYLFDAEKDEIRDLGDKGLSKDFLETMNLRWRRLPRQRALTQGEPVVIRDAANDLRQAAIRDAVIREGYRSLAIFPLRSRGTTIGGMNFYFDTPQDFGEEQLSLCRAFASQTAIAIANSQLFDRLALEKHRLSAILDSSNQGIMMVDVSGNVVLVNRWMTNLFQLRATGTIEEREEFLSRCFSDPEAFLRKTLRLFEDPEATADEVFEIDLPDHRILRRFSAPVRDEKEKIIGRLFVYRDITKEQQIERMKNEFISVVSHEIRTPLTSLRGSLGLLAAGMAGELQPQGQELLEIAVNNCDRLIRLINDILDLEKIEAGKMELHIAPCSLEELVARSVNEMQGFADGHEVTLETDLPPCQVSADADRVVQVLTNLLSNAVKFSEAGGRVTVGARLVEADVEVRVEDRGRGIPASAIENVFGKFQQVDASDSRQKGGTGLGLAICQAIVSQHGGRIWVESEEGVGSTFFFTLPLTAASAAEPAPEPRAAGAPRVLVCDDDRDFVRLLQLLLNQAGYEVLPAYSGEEALETLSRTEVNAVLLDVRLPKMSGPDVLREIKSRPETASLPVIIVSGLPPSELEDVPTPLVLDWLTKPLDEARLLRRLREAARRASRPTVLLVDDDQGLLDLLTRLLNQVSPDVRVRTAEGGRQAVEICRREMPSLIVLDILMPDGDGFFVIDALREDLALRRIPVVVYSAVEPNEEDRRRLTVGTTQFLTKSKVKEEDFASQVIELLNGLLPAGVGGERGG